MFLMALLRNDCMNDGLVVLVILRMLLICDTKILFFKIDISIIIGFLLLMLYFTVLCAQFLNAMEYTNLQTDF